MDSTTNNPENIPPDELVIYDTPRRLGIMFQRMQMTTKDMLIHHYRKQTEAYKRYDNEVPKVFFVAKRSGKFSNIMFALALDVDKIYLTDLHGKFGKLEIDAYNECVDFIYKNLVSKFVLDTSDVRLIKYKDNIGRFVSEKTASKFNLWLAGSRRDNFSMLGPTYDKWKEFVISYVENDDNLPIEELRRILGRYDFPDKKLNSVVRLFIYGVDLLSYYKHQPAINDVEF